MSYHFIQESFGDVREREVTSGSHLCYGSCDILGFSLGGDIIVIEIVGDKPTWLIPCFIVVVLELLIECIESEGMPLLQSIGHIDTLDMHMTFWEEEEKIGKNIENRSQYHGNKFW